MFTATTYAKRYLIVVIHSSIIICLLLNCTTRKTDKVGRHVTIRKTAGRYEVYKNNEVFTIKGASGYTFLNTLQRAGGNTIRVWDTTHLATILDSARANHLMVIAGLPVFNQNDDNSFYDTPTRVAAQHKAFKAIINKYKHDPTLLMWCVGNELPFPNGLSYYKFYKAFNQLTDMIREDDPNHPITTTISNFNSKYVFNLVTRCDIDVISFNIFGSVQSLRQDLANIAWFWDGPYMITEWAVNGPWAGTGVDQTAWGAFIESTSKKKAEIYANYYQHYLPLEDPRFLGAFVFYWGSKQETTHTWFSLFDELGNKTEAIEVMKTLWTKKADTLRFPQIDYMLINKKGARDNILLTADKLASAELKTENTATIKQVKWQIFQEDWYLENKKSNTKRFVAFDSIINRKQEFSIRFCTPLQEGPYRLFATIYDQSGNIAQSNIPFYVVSNK